jgi:hypothetical protein
LSVGKEKILENHTALKNQLRGGDVGGIVVCKKVINHQIHLKLSESQLHVNGLVKPAEYSVKKSPYRASPARETSDHLPLCFIEQRSLGGFSWVGV